MTIIEISTLVGAILAIALGIGYYSQRNHKTLKEMTENYYDNEQAINNIEVISEEITPGVLNKVVKLGKQLPPQAVVDLGPMMEQAKPKKKRKYYPKAPKTKV